MAANEGDDDIALAVCRILFWPVPSHKLGPSRYARPTGRADCATMARLLYTSALVGRHGVKNAKMRHPLLRPLYALSAVGRNKPLGCSRSRAPRRWGTRQVTTGMAARASGLRIGCLALSSNGAGVGKAGQAAIKPDGGVVLKQDKDTALRGARNDECRPNGVPVRRAACQS
ncbi:hypothetical protein ERJ75_001505300 [Trypanosoma vivax]|nr:hypothetical protein ERJ75_001505300 [Trypanosoma vivax]